MRCYNTIVIQVDHFVPILECSQGSLIFLREHEPDKVFVTHLTLLTRVEFPWNLIENSIDSFSREGMTLISREVLFIDKEIVVCVQLPESTIQYIEVLVGEVLPNFVNVLLISYGHKNIEEVRFLKVAKGDISIVIGVQ